jgi:hypothetical protein
VLPRVWRCNGRPAPVHCDRPIRMDAYSPGLNALLRAAASARRTRASVKGRGLVIAPAQAPHSQPRPLHTFGAARSQQG